MKHRFNTHTGFCRIVITVIAIALCVTIGATAANTVRLPGDMDRDGQITPADARIVLRIAVKLEDVNDYMDGPADDPSRPTAMIPGVEDGVLTVDFPKEEAKKLPERRTILIEG